MTAAGSLSCGPMSAVACAVANIPALKPKASATWIFIVF
jgi:ApbE superfamily uncharacterized protein (UPF0280 family)